MPTGWVMILISATLTTLKFTTIHIPKNSGYRKVIRIPHSAGQANFKIK